MRIATVLLLGIASVAFAASPHKPRRPTAPVPPQALPGFVYRDFTLRVARADGTPLAGATVYGFCPDLNLIWPRAGDEADRTGAIVDIATVQKTGNDGSVKVTVPPGKWGFFAVGRNGPAILAAWSDFRDRGAGETVTISPLAQTRHWTLSAGGDDVLKPRRLFLKPPSFPMWLSIDADSVDADLSGGPVHLWASRGATTTDSPGFALDFGTVNHDQSDGKLSAGKSVAALICKGGGGHAKLEWCRYQQVGLEGTIELAANATVLMSPGPMLLGYQRPLPNGMTGTFASQFHSLAAGPTMPLNFDSPLTAALDQFLDEDDHTLSARLYLVDANNHVLSGATDAKNRPAKFEATVTINGKSFTATPLRIKKAMEQKVEENRTVVEADISPLTSADGATWTFTSPAGLGIPPKLKDASGAALATVTSPTFRVEVPQILAAQARSVLAQAEMVARTMEQCSGRTRQKTPTRLLIKPEKGASAGHNGDHINMGSGLFFTRSLPERHTFDHELGHNFNLNHGGLMETIVEATRCGTSNPQISQQLRKWIFLDRMNGIPGKEVGYHNSGLYFYFYAQGGAPFLHYISANEQAVAKKLGPQNFTDDEIETAVCSLALGRDVGPICRQYGLVAEPARVEQAISAARAVLPRP
jgi:hypothetical protein